MSQFATITSDFTSHGKESEGFYENVDKIIKWRKNISFIMELKNYLTR